MASSVHLSRPTHSRLDTDPDDPISPMSLRTRPSATHHVPYEDARTVAFAIIMIFIMCGYGLKLVSVIVRTTRVNDAEAHKPIHTHHPVPTARPKWPPLHPHPDATPTASPTPIPPDPIAEGINEFWHGFLHWITPDGHFWLFGLVGSIAIYSTIFVAYLFVGIVRRCMLWMQTLEAAGQIDDASHPLYAEGYYPP